MGKLRTCLGAAMFGALVISSAAYAVSGAPLGGPGPAIAGGGGNLTGFTGGYGAINNNQWNTMMNTGKGTRPVADFGNCNAVIIRCASPKCVGTACADMTIATTIVRGCVESNAGCKQYGDDLIQYITAQLAATAAARANDAAAASAAAASASAASTQSAQQLTAMQQQMQALQTQMAMQQQQAQEQLQAALAVRDTPAPVAEPIPSASTSNVAANADVAMESAIARGVSADAIARNQASGRILTQLENVTAAMANVKKAMQDTFDYAGCDSRGENCTGPNRVTAFKQKASAFFDPFETVQDEVYDALIQAQALGVDISDIYMMLSSSCNVWGQYLCESGQVLRYSAYTYEENCVNSPTVRCPPTPDLRSKIVPMADGGCQLLRTLTSGETIYQSWLDVPSNEGGRTVAVACASDALDNSKFFQNRRKKIDDVGIDDLALILSQDAIVPAAAAPAGLDRVCATDSQTLSGILMANRYGMAEAASEIVNPTVAPSIDFGRAAVGTTYDSEKGACESTGGVWMTAICSCPAGYVWAADKTRGCEVLAPASNDYIEQNQNDERLCTILGGVWTGVTCLCPNGGRWDSSRKICQDTGTLSAPTTADYLESQNPLSNMGMGSNR